MRLALGGLPGYQLGHNADFGVPFHLFNKSGIIRFCFINICSCQEYNYAKKKIKEAATTERVACFVSR